MNPEMNQNSTTDGQPLDKCMAMLDQFIQAGGASAEDLQNLKMDLEDTMGRRDNYEGETSTTPSTPSDMSGMIENMQRGA